MPCIEIKHEKSCQVLNKNMQTLQNLTIQTWSKPMSIMGFSMFEKTEKVVTKQDLSTS